MGPWVSGISYKHKKLRQAFICETNETNKHEKKHLELHIMFFVGRVMVSIPEIPTKPAINEMPSKTSSHLNPVTPARRWL